MDTNNSAEVFEVVRPRVLVVSLKADSSVNLAPPTGLYQLMGHLHKNDIVCDIVDRDLEGMEPYMEKLLDGYYQIVGFSVSRIHMTEDLTLIWEIKTKLEEHGINCIYIGGGQEATSNSRQWLDSGLDLIFKGFCERELVKFCNNLTTADFLNGVPSLDDATKGVQGVAYKNGDEYVEIMAPYFGTEQLVELCYDTVMDVEIPYIPYWKMLHERAADTSLGSAEFIIENVRVYTTSHCPRACGFCSSQSFLPDAQGKQSPIVMLSAQQVYDVVAMYAKRYGAVSVLFTDDDFPVGNKQGLDRLEELCELLIEGKKKGDIPENMRFSCQARVYDFMIREGNEKVVNMKILRLMKDAGFLSIGMGVETYVDRILKAPSVNKLGVSAEDCRNVINALLEVGLVPQTNLILGIPEYTVDELIETLETAFEYIQKGADVATSAVMNSIPGAPVHNAGIYETVYRYWRNPFTNETMKIHDYFLPQDQTIRDGIPKFRELADKELEEIRTQRGWEGKILHKRIAHVCNLIAVARGIKREDVANRFRQKLEEIMDKSEKATGFHQAAIPNDQAGDSHPRAN